MHVSPNLTFSQETKCTIFVAWVSWEAGAELDVCIWEVQWVMLSGTVLDGCEVRGKQGG